MTDSYDVIVVGGGHNGLVAAFYLAQAGLKVIVLERRGFVGGACVTEELFEGYRVSSCSYVCWMLQPKVIADLELARHGFKYSRIDPGAFIPYPDGSHLFLWEDERRTRAEFARLNEDDASQLGAWRSFWYRAAALINQFFLRDPPSDEELRGHARNVGEEGLLDRLLSNSFADICESFFKDKRIQAALAQVEDVGDPWTPGSALTSTYFNCNAFTDVGYAVVHGGMGAITQAMAQAVTEQGGEVRVNAEVEAMLVDAAGVQGVRLRNGTELRAALVVSNADPKRTLLGLVEPEALDPAFRSQIDALSTKASYLKFHSIMGTLPDTSAYLGRAPEPREVGYIKIAPSLEHFRHAFEQASRGEPALEPIVHIQVPTIYDSTLTNRGDHVVSMWALYAPPRLAGGDWESRRNAVGESLIDYVSRFIPNFRDDMLEWRLFSPWDLEQRVGLTDGNIRHLDIIPNQFLDRRPLPKMHYETPIRGLYLCGAGTHPGGEVTGAPGHNCASAILRARQPAAVV